MDIRKPKPVHNFREFLSEVFVIVFGIGIALLGERAVQSYEWSENLKRSENAMREEIAGDDGPQVVQRIAIAPCINSALDHIRQSVESGASRDVILSDIAATKIADLRTWEHIAFDAANSSGVLARMDPERLTGWSAFYAMMAPLQEAEAREFRDAAGLRAISHTGGALSEAEKFRLLDAAELLKRDNQEITIYSSVAGDAMGHLHIVIQPAVRDRNVAFWEKVPNAAACFADVKARFEDFSKAHHS